MNVYQFAAKRPNEIGCQDSHEAGKHDEIRVVAENMSHKRSIELVPGAEIPMINHKGLNVCLGGPLKCEGFGLIAAQSHDLAGEIPFPAGVDQGLKVGSTARGQHQNSGQSRLVRFHSERSPGA